jgi:hypothetical protein
MQNFDHNIGFWEKRQFFRRKLSKLAEICDHNIGPRAWSQSYDFRFYNYVQRRRLPRQERFFKVEEKTLILKRSVQLVEL